MKMVELLQTKAARLQDLNVLVVGILLGLDMYKVDLGREYGPLNDISYQWLKQNAPGAKWVQWCGYTHVEFEDILLARRFKKYMRLKLNENPPTK